MPEKYSNRKLCLVSSSSRTWKKLSSFTRLTYLVVLLISINSSSLFAQYNTTIFLASDSLVSSYLDVIQDAQGNTTAIGMYEDNNNAKLFLTKSNESGGVILSKSYDLSVNIVGSTISLSLNQSSFISGSFIRETENGYFLTLSVENKDTQHQFPLLVNLDKDGSILWTSAIDATEGLSTEGKISVRDLKIINGKYLFLVYDEISQNTSILEWNEVTNQVANVSTLIQFDGKRLLHTPGYISSNTAYSVVGQAITGNFYQKTIRLFTLGSSFQPLVNAIHEYQLQIPVNSINVTDAFYEAGKLYILSNSFEVAGNITSYISYLDTPNYTGNSWTKSYLFRSILGIETSQIFTKILRNEFGILATGYSFQPISSTPQGVVAQLANDGNSVEKMRVFKETFQEGPSIPLAIIESNNKLIFAGFKYHSLASLQQIYPWTSVLDMSLNQGSNECMVTNESLGIKDIDLKVFYNEEPHKQIKLNQWESNAVASTITIDQNYCYQEDTNNSESYTICTSDSMKLLGTVSNEFVGKIMEKDSAIYFATSVIENEKNIVVLRKLDLKSGVQSSVKFPENTSVTNYTISNNDIYVLGHTTPFDSQNRATLARIKDSSEGLSLDYINYYNLGSRQSFRGLHIGANGELIIHGHRGAFSQDDINILKLNEDGTPIRRVRHHFDDDQMWSSLVKDVDGKYLYFGEEADAVNEGFLVQMNEDLSVSKAFSFFGIPYIVDVAVNTATKQRILLSRNSICAVNPNFEVTHNLYTSKTSYRNIHGPITGANNEDFYFVTGRMNINNENVSVVQKIELKDESIHTVWIKVFDVGQLNNSFGSIHLGGDDNFIYTESRIDTINGHGLGDIVIAEYPRDSCYFYDIQRTSQSRDVNRVEQEMQVSELEVPPFESMASLPSDSLACYVYDPCLPDSCNIEVSFSVACNTIHLQASPSMFSDTTSLEYTWTTPDGSMMSVGKDTSYTYTGAEATVIICLEASDGNCTAMTCDTIAVSQPIPPQFEQCISTIDLEYGENCQQVYEHQNIPIVDPCTGNPLTPLCLRSDGMELDAPYSIGPTTITCVVTSEAGLKDTCTTVVNVRDMIQPECTPLEPIRISLDPSGIASILLGDLPVPATDACSEVMYMDSDSLLVFDCSHSDIVLDVVIVDGYNNQKSCPLNVTVEDKIAPQCFVQDLVVPAVSGVEEYTLNYNFDITDNCPEGLVVSFSIPNGSTVSCGYTSEVTMTASDASGNNASCTFTVSVGECFEDFGTIQGVVMDDEACDGSIVGDTPLSEALVALIRANGTDTIKVVNTNDQGIYVMDSIPYGAYLVRPILGTSPYRITHPDAGYYNVSVSTMDTIKNIDFGLAINSPNKPIPFEKKCYTIGDTIPLRWEFSPCGARQPIAIYMQACGGSSPTLVASGIDNTGSYDYIVTDDSVQELEFFFEEGTKFECVEIRKTLDIDFDTELLGCKELKFTATNNTYSAYQWFFGDDNSSFGESSITYSYSQSKSYTVCLEVSTPKGCKKRVCKEVTVPPCDECNVSFEYVDEGCYDVSVTTRAENYQDGIRYQWTVNNSPSFTQKTPYFNLDGPGTYEICISANDAICSDRFCRTIIKDTIYPELLNCPTETVRYDMDENCSPIRHDTPIRRGMFCHKGDATNPEIQFSRSDGLSMEAPYGEGLTSVTASFTDLFGITSTCTYQVEVVDNIVPICQSKDLSIDLDASGVASIVPSDLDNGSSDNCGEVSLGLSKQTFTCEDIGVNTVNLLVSDGHNIVGCPATITVHDMIAPACTFDDFDVYVDEDGNIDLSQDNILYSVSDNCEVTSIEFLGLQDVKCNTNPWYATTLRAKDSSNNITTCDAKVFVKDTIFPVCGEHTFEYMMTPDRLGKHANIPLPFSLHSDNCEVISATAIYPLASCETVGNNIIIHKIRDTRGNESVCEINLIIKDAIPPVCIIDDMEVTATDGEGATVNFGGKATDVCNDDIAITYSMEDGGYYACGEYTITMTATDNHGNASSCDFTLKVDDCDGCCVSEEKFIEATDGDFEIKSSFQQDNCLISIKSPTLDSCQYVSGIDWGDGTISEFTIMGQNELEHLYTEAGTYNLCLTYTEADNANFCFTNRYCDIITVFDNCTFTRQSLVKHSKILVFPNPSENLFTVKTLDGRSISQYRVLDVSGKVHVQAKKALVTSSLDIYLDHNASGLYFLELIFDDGSRNIVKLVKI